MRRVSSDDLVPRFQQALQGFLESRDWRAGDLRTLLENTTEETLVCAVLREEFWRGGQFELDGVVIGISTGLGGGVHGLRSLPGQHSRLRALVGKLARAHIGSLGQRVRAVWMARRPVPRLLRPNQPNETRKPDDSG